MLERQAKSIIRAFTLIELLVVIAIIAILAAILFPVFAQARAAAMKTIDISNMRQITMAHNMYSTDNDDHMPRSNSGGYVGCWGCGPPDTVPGMVMMPYVKNEDVFFSALEPWGKDKMRIIRDHAQDRGWNVNNLTPQQRLYALMVRTNIGYNYLFFSPWRNLPQAQGGQTSYSLALGEIGNPSGTLQWASSIWWRTPSGAIYGAGNWVIEAPCDRDINNNILRPRSMFVGPGSDNTGDQYTNGWCLNTCSVPDFWLAYGGMWPFHNQVKVGTQPGLKDGHVVAGFADGSVKSVWVKRTMEGCNPLGTLQGRVFDKDKYIWDLE